MDVIGIGRAVYDRVFVVEKYPEADEKTEAIERHFSGGSPVPTALCQLAKWGHETKLCARIGNDPDGDLFLKDTRAYGVDVSGVIISDTESTPQAILIVEKGTGKRTVVLDRTITPISRAEIPYDELKKCKVLLLDGWEADAAIAAAEYARKNGCKVMLDAGNVRPRMEEQLANTDWLVAPVAFAKAYMPGEDLFQVARHLLTKGIEIAIITNGAAGCVAAWGNDVQWFPAFKSSQVIDSTGAGDLFHAGLIHGILEGYSLEQNIQWASATSCLAVGALGGRGCVPSRTEVESFLQERGISFP